MTGAIAVAFLRERRDGDRRPTSPLGLAEQQFLLEPEQAAGGTLGEEPGRGSPGLARADGTTSATMAHRPASPDVTTRNMNDLVVVDRIGHAVAGTPTDAGLAVLYGLPPPKQGCPRTDAMVQPRVRRRQMWLRQKPARHCDSRLDRLQLLGRSATGGCGLARIRPRAACDSARDWVDGEPAQRPDDHAGGVCLRSSAQGPAAHEQAELAGVGARRAVGGPDGPRRGQRHRVQAAAGHVGVARPTL